MGKTMSDEMKNISRLNRVTGQLVGIKRMIEEERTCPDVIIQLRAARSALKAIEINVLKMHLNKCVNQLSEKGANKDEKIEELKMLFTQIKD